MRVDICMKTGNLNHLATVPRCPGRVLVAEKLNVSTNAVACVARQWPSLTQESMNNTWKCLFYCFVLSHYFSYGAGILSIPKQTLNILLLRKIFYIALYSVFI